MQIIREGKETNMQGNALNRLKSFAEDIFQDRKRLIRILLIIFILMLAVLLRVHENSKADITIEGGAAEGGSGEPAQGEICVDIGGAVVNPGVYTVGRDTRLYEVIELAGGLISNADTDAINRAAYVEDGEKIIIPSKPVQYAETDGGGSQPVNGTGEGATGENGSDSASDSPDVTESGGTAAAGSGLVNINYASKEELMTLTGIGEAKADKIIEYRSSTRFRKKEDIKSVNGIGDSIYNKIKDSITV